MEETIADLHHIAEYAQDLRRQLVCKRVPNQAMLNRLRDLAEKIQRHYDPQLEELGNGQARSGNGA